MNKRDPYFDNLKFILILFVVLGHFTTLNLGNVQLASITNVIYSFHMPVFIFISGYFSKNINKQRKTEIDHLLFSYIVFELLNNIYANYSHFGRASHTLHILTPTAQNWYLVGLLFWRTIAPYFNLFNHYVCFFSSLFFSLIIGFDEQLNSFLCLYRILYFTPFFILGYYCADFKIIFNKYLKYKNKLIVIFFISTSVIYLISSYNETIRINILYGYNPYNGYKASVSNFIIRLIGFFSSTIISICFLYLVPTKTKYYTKFGRNTFNIFLLHQFIIYPLVPMIDMQSNYSVLYTIIASIIITYLLSLEIINKVIQPLTKISFYKEIFNYPKNKTN